MIKGLKQKLSETISEGSYQCYRAEKYIDENQLPKFSYVEDSQRKTLVIDKTSLKQIIKVSVTYESFSTISINLKYLIDAGILSSDYKTTWIVSLYDLMIFADLIETEDDFKDYINDRLNLYDRQDIQFLDEIDILGYYFDGNLSQDVKEQNYTQLKINLI